MPSGACFCGEVAYEYSGEPHAKALCHCIDCRKITGSTYSTNIIVDGSGFKVTKGSPKTYTKKADSGNDVHSYFCGNCGSTIYRDGKTFGDNKVVKVGTLDDLSALENAKPGVELFSPERVSWVAEVSGAGQKPAMP